MPIIKAYDSDIKHDGSHSTCRWNDRLKTIQTSYEEFYCYPVSKEFFLSENICNSTHSTLQGIFWKFTDLTKLYVIRKEGVGV